MKVFLIWIFLQWIRTQDAHQTRYNEISFTIAWETKFMMPNGGKDSKVKAAFS